MARAFISFLLIFLLQGCATAIVDYEFCSPLPGGLGSICDHFLTAHQEILTEEQWVALQAQWLSQGQATECTTANALGDLKKEIEELCSKTRCSYEAVQIITSGLNKIQNLGKAAVP